MMLASPPPLGRPWLEPFVILVALLLPWAWVAVLDRLLRRIR